MPAANLTPRLAQALVITLLLAGCAAQQPDTPPASSENTVSRPLVAAPPPQAVPPPQAQAAAEAGAAPAARPNVGDASTTARDRRVAAEKHGVNRLMKPKSEVGATANLMAQPWPGAPAPAADTAQYGKLDDNPVRVARSEPVSTFSIDVDTGAYANVRRFLRQGQLPPSDAVRVEEMVNYFPYDYPLPQAGGAPFSVALELAPTPWNADTHLLRIGLKGQDVAKQSLPPANLVFLVDVSGSMSPPERLPLLKAALKLLVPQLRAQDRVSLVVYASGTGVVLEPTPGDQHARIVAALDGLHAQGSTYGEGGLRLAYHTARQAFIPGGINRILLATDGDFNVGITNFEQIKKLVEDERKAGISLSTLGFGTNNYNERLMEQIADAGDGNYSYIDQLHEGHKVLVNEMTSTLATIAKDVKIQVEFNPAEVLEYRLVGYENRLLRNEDFANDRVDAGEVGAGHTVTALYELTLAGATKRQVEALRYGEPPAVAGEAKFAGELGELRIRYKVPNGESSKRIAFPIVRAMLKPLPAASPEYRFAAAVAGFGQLLRGGRHTGGFDYEQVQALARPARGEDRFGYRNEFIQLVDLAKALVPGKPGGERRELREALHD
jgi:Ca-activated chloride channel homolog